jgi:hypothetical protein
MTTPTTVSPSFMSSSLVYPSQCRWGCLSRRGRSSTSGSCSGRASCAFLGETCCTRENVGSKRARGRARRSRKLVWRLWWYLCWVDGVRTSGELRRGTTNKPSLASHCIASQSHVVSKVSVCLCSVFARGSVDVPAVIEHRIIVL